MASWISASVTCRRALGLFLAGALLTSAPACEAAQKILRIGYILSNSSQLGAGADVFAAEVARRTGERYRIEAYPDSMLGSEPAMMQNIKIGALDAAIITCAALSAAVPATGIFNIPFMFQDADQARRLLDGPIGAEYLVKVDEAGFVALAWGENGLRHVTASSSRDLANPEGMKGLKLRLPQSEVMAAGFEALGAKVQRIPFNQLYNALKDGRVEAQENPIATIVASRFSQVQTRLVLTGHVYDPAIILVSRDVFDSLSADDRASFSEAARLGGRASRRYAEEQERTGVDILRAQGMSVDRVDRAAFAQAFGAAVSRWNAMFGAPEIARIRGYAAARAVAAGSAAGP